MTAGLTAERLRELLRYEPETGVFRWLVLETKSHVKVGDVAGYIDNGIRCGYRKIKIDGHQYMAHRLAWLYMTGEWPREQIDHINTDRADNRWSNLRGATQVQNSANSRLREHNPGGFKGVHLHNPGRWRANIRVNGRQNHLGLFDTAERAFIAYTFAAWKHFGDFARVDADCLVALRQRKAVLRNLADLSIYARAA